MDLEHESLKIEMRELGATVLQRQVLERDVPRARAAIAEAIKRGAGRPIVYALSLFNSPSFQTEHRARPKPVNLHGPEDPRYTDDGERIWQWYEVDDEWRHSYLEETIRALHEHRPLTEVGDLPRYQFSDEELQAWAKAMRRQGAVLRLDPSSIRHTAERALDAWSEVWGFENLRAILAQYDDDPEPSLEDDLEPALV